MELLIISRLAYEKEMELRRELERKARYRWDDYPADLDREERKLRIRQMIRRFQRQPECEPLCK